MNLNKMITDRAKELEEEAKDYAAQLAPYENLSDHQNKFQNDMNTWFCTKIAELEWQLKKKADKALICGPRRR